MPFGKNRELLRSLIEDAARSHEIQENLAEFNANRIEEIISSVEHEYVSIWDFAREEIDRYDDLEKRKNEGEQELLRQTPRPPVSLTISDFIVGALRLYLGIAVIGCFFGIPSLGPIGMWHWMLITWHPMLVWLPLLLGILVVPTRFRLQRSHDANKTKITSALRPQLREIAAQQDRAASAAKLTARTAALAMLRKAINEAQSPTFSTTLEMARSAKLDGTYDSALRVNTPAQRRLQSILGNWKGGSIGIAGPRGAGKSTLINSVCSGDIPISQDKELMGVAISAPVEYEPREFLLHLFATVCHRVLERKRKQYSRFDWKDEIAPKVSWHPDFFLLLLRGTAIAFLAAILLSFSSIALAWLDVHISDADADKPAVMHQFMPSRVTAQNVTPPPVSTSQAAGATTDSLLRDSTKGSIGDRYLHTPTRMEILALFIKDLGITSAGLLTWALWLGIFSVVSYAIAKRYAGRLTVSTQEMLDDPDSETRPRRRSPLQRVATIYASMLFFPLFKDFRRVYAAFTPRQNVPEPASCEREARMWLTEIKFQQNFSSSVSGGVKQLGLEGAFNLGRSLAQQQLTLPEIVDGFSRFLAQITLDLNCIVVVGIDELDKLDSDETAQRFLNEIKAIFGVYHVFYLVSVSENAMSSFERRGLPFRDVFDSSFDEIISVDYLDFAHARRMLNERVIGMPMQFQALCYCLSGGLARELIRCFRDLVEQASLPTNNRDLGSLARVLVWLELRDRARAVGFAATRLEAEPERGELLHLLHQLSLSPPTSSTLLSAYERLCVDCELAATDESPERPAQAALKRLSVEIGTYVYYLATVLEFFTSMPSRATMERAMGSGLDELARSYQALATSSTLSRQLLNDFRKNEWLYPPSRSHRNPSRRRPGTFHKVRSTQSPESNVRPRSIRRVDRVR